MIWSDPREYDQEDARRDAHDVSTPRLAHAPAPWPLAGRSTCPENHWRPGTAGSGLRPRSCRISHRPREGSPFSVPARAGRVPYDLSTQNPQERGTAFACHWRPHDVHCQRGQRLYGAGLSVQASRETRMTAGVVGARFTLEARRSPVARTGSRRTRPCGTDGPTFRDPFAAMRPAPAPPVAPECETRHANAQSKSGVAAGFSTPQRVGAAGDTTRESASAGRAVGPE
jgi:hypothetical protein